MKREILFRRAHYTYKGEFDSFSFWGFVEYGFQSPRAISSCDPSKAIDEQFTGLTDKNGNKIFEGDKTNGGEIIVFSDGIFGTTYNGNKQGISRLSEKRCKYFEITGNIHDNDQI